MSLEDALNKEPPLGTYRAVVELRGDLLVATLLAESCSQLIVYATRVSLGCPFALQKVAIRGASTYSVCLGTRHGVETKYSMDVKRTRGVVRVRM